MTRVLLAIILLTGPAYDSALEQRVWTLSQQFRCLVCQNQTIADSQADLAADLRQQIREQMRAGRSDAEITTFLTDRYGDFVRYRPPVKPQTYALWFGPFLLLSCGLFGLYRFLKRWPQRTKDRRLSAKEQQHAASLLKEQDNPNLDVYREHFAELESDLRSGVIGVERFEQDREELARRLLEDCR